MKTIEQKAAEYVVNAPNRSMYDAYLAGANEALANQWRDASKETPCIGQEVVWKIRHRTPRGTWIDGYIQDCYDGEYIPDNVEHWMPLPELPTPKPTEK